VEIGGEQHTFWAITSHYAKLRSVGIKWQFGVGSGTTEEPSNGGGGEDNNVDIVMLTCRKARAQDCNGASWRIMEGTNMHKKAGNQD